MDLPPVLNAVVNGTWDLNAARAEQQTQSDIGMKSRMLVNEYIAAVRAKDREGELRAAQQVARFPVKYCEGMSPDYWGWTAQVECLVELQRLDEAKSVAMIASETPGIGDDAYGMAQIAESLKPVALEEAARYADQSMKIVSEFEARTPTSEWERFLAEGEQRRFAASRIIAADIRAAQARTEEAITLLESAIAAWPDNERFIPNKTTLKQRLEEYKARRTTP